MSLFTNLLLYTGLVVTFIALEPVSAQCTWLTVSGSDYSSQTGLNGQYQLSYNYLCDGLVIYMETYSYLPVNYIFYGSSFQNNGTQLTAGWLIGTQMCHSGEYAKNTGGYNEYPYNLPAGTWQEWNPSTNLFVNNPNITITCNSDLSTGAIIGIVIGSLCGAIILLSIIGAICRNHQYKKRRQTMAQTAMEMPPATVSNYAYAYPNTGYYPQQPGPGSNPSDFDPTYATVNDGSVFMLQPPPYDNQQPPGYSINK